MALAELAGAEVAVKGVHAQACDNRSSEVFAVVELASATLKSVVFSFPQPTAEAFARRMLAGRTGRSAECRENARMFRLLFRRGWQRDQFQIKPENP